MIIGAFVAAVGEERSEQVRETLRSAAVEASLRESGLIVWCRS